MTKVDSIAPLVLASLNLKVQLQELTYWQKDAYRANENEYVSQLVQKFRSNIIALHINGLSVEQLEQLYPNISKVIEFYRVNV